MGNAPTRTAVCLVGDGWVIGGQVCTRHWVRQRHVEGTTPSCSQSPPPPPFSPPPLQFLPSKCLPGGEAGVRSLVSTLDVGEALLLDHVDLKALQDPALMPQHKQLPDSKVGLCAVHQPPCPPPAFTMSPAGSSCLEGALTRPCTVPLACARGYRTFPA